MDFLILKNTDVLCYGINTVTYQESANSGCLLVAYKRHTLETITYLIIFRYSLDLTPSICDTDIRNRRVFCPSNKKVQKY